MRKLKNIDGIVESVKRNVTRMNLDLSGLVIMTEVASGPFVLSPFIALIAGAKKVIAISKTTKYGDFDEVKSYVNEIAEYFEFSGELVITSDKLSCANEVDIVTNSAMLRPLDQVFCSLLKDDALIGLMFEPWEKRKQDIDYKYCFLNGISVIGVNEQHENLRIFDYVGLLAVKLSLENEVGILGENVLVIGSGIFGLKVKEFLEKLGATVSIVDVLQDKLDIERVKNKKYSSVYICEHNVDRSIIAENGILNASFFLENKPSVINICGNIDFEFIKSKSIDVYPEIKVPFGYMTLTTDYVGPEPVIRLFTGGLKAASEFRINRNNDRYEYALPLKDYE